MSAARRRAAKAFGGILPSAEGGREAGGAPRPGVPGTTREFFVPYPASVERFKIQTGKEASPPNAFAPEGRCGA